MSTMCMAPSQFLWRENDNLKDKGKGKNFLVTQERKRGKEVKYPFVDPQMFSKISSYHKMLGEKLVE